MKKKGLVCVVLSVLSVVALAMLVFPMASGATGGDDNCFKVDVDDAFKEASGNVSNKCAGAEVSSVCIKAATETFCSSNSCFTIDYDGANWSLSENWPDDEKGSECHDVSHYTVCWSCGSEPTPTPETEPTPTPETEPTPTPPRPIPTPEDDYPSCWPRKEILITGCPPADLVISQWIDFESSDPLTEPTGQQLFPDRPWVGEKLIYDLDYERSYRWWGWSQSKGWIYLFDDTTGREKAWNVSCDVLHNEYHFDCPAPTPPPVPEQLPETGYVPKPASLGLVWAILTAGGVIA